MNGTRQNDITWTTSCILMVTSLGLPAQHGYANVPAFTAAQAKQMVRMQDMRWVARLSPQPLDEVRSALRSGHPMVIEPALHNAVLHGLAEFVPIIEESLGAPMSYVRHFGKMCAEVLKVGSNPFEQFRRALESELPGDEFIPNCDKMDYCRPVRHMVTSLIVIGEVRAVRAGQKKDPNLHGLHLSSFDTELAKLTRFKVSQAIDGILDQLSKAQVGGRREYILLQVLHTYPPDRYVPSILEKLERAGATQGYGKVLLLRSLRFRCAALDNEHVAKLRSIIDSIRQTEPSPSLDKAVSALESELE